METNMSTISNLAVAPEIHQGEGKTFFIARIVRTNSIADDIIGEAYGYTSKQAEENASNIVRAVNSFNDMHKVLDLINKTAEPDKDGYISITKTTLMLVKQALAKSEVK